MATAWRFESQHRSIVESLKQLLSIESDVKSSILLGVIKRCKARRPGIVLVEKKKQMCLITDIAVPVDANFIEQEIEKV